MKDQNKTSRLSENPRSIGPRARRPRGAKPPLRQPARAQLLAELASMRQRVAELETLEIAHKQAEAALIHELDLLHILMDHIPDRIYFKDTASRFTRINKALAEILGIDDPAEAIGKTDSDFFDAELARKFYADEQEIMKSGRPLINKVEESMGPGRRFCWAMTTKVPILDNDGQVIGIVGISRDVTEHKQMEEALQKARDELEQRVEERTAEWRAINESLQREIVERKQAEEALRESEERYRSLIETSPDAVTLTDLNSQVLVCNQQSALLYGYANAEDMIGQNAFEFIAPEDRPRALENARKTLETGSIKNIEYTLLKKDGSRFPAELSASVIPNAEGKPRAFVGVVRDITERKRAEEALAHEHTLLRTLIDLLPDAIYAKDVAGRKALANRADLRNMGVQTEAEALGKTDFDVFPQEIAARFHADDQAILQTGQPLLDREEIIVTGDGQRRWQLTSKMPLRDSAGQVVGLVGVGHDITERKRAETALRESEERYRRITEAITDYIYTVHVEAGQAVETRHGPGCVAITGYTSEEFAADPYLWFHMVVEQDRPAVLDQARRVLAGEAALALEHRIIRKDGAQRWVRNTPVPLHDKGGKLVAYDGLIQDITERKQAEEALRESEQQLAAIFREIPTIISIGTLAEGRYLAVNDAFLRVTDYSRAEVIGKTVFELGVYRGLEDRNRLLAQIREQGFVRNFEMSFRTRSGRPIYGLVSTQSISFQGLPCILTVISDITERKRMEEALRESEQSFRQLAEENARLLEQARQDAQAKARLLQEINHRVKNNLASIIGLLYTEQRYAEAQDPPAYQAVMTHLANRLEGLVQAHDMLSATEWAPLPLDELARQVIHTALKTLPGDKGVRVEVTSSGARVTPKQANSLALVINELTVNTMKYALRDRYMAGISVRIAPEGEEIVFEFRNDGPGYPDVVLRGEYHTLGLYLIQNIARYDLRGEITFRNDPGPVTTLRFKNDAAISGSAQEGA